MSTSSRRFELQQCLGRGSFGEVYAASMRSAGGLNTRVAVKLLRADIDLGGEAVRRLRDEGRLLAKLSHPAILRVYDLTRLDGRLALITELVDGEDLTGLFKGEAAIGPRALCQAIGQVAGALDAALNTESDTGTLRMVHRDVKPSNIRIDRHGQAKLLDFGVARFDASDREVRTASDMVVGSIPFMAPERFVQREVHPSSDVFSLGCTLYQGLTHARFYGRKRVAAITAMALRPANYQLHLQEQLDGVGDVELRTLLAGMLHPHAEQRPTAAEVARDLEALADDMPGPSLRMFCRSRTWPAGEEEPGSLCGRVLEEGVLIEANSGPVAGEPVVRMQGAETLDPETLHGLTSTPPREHSDFERPYTAETERPPIAPADTGLERVEPTLVPAAMPGLATLPLDGMASKPTLQLPDSGAATVLRHAPPSYAEPEADGVWIGVFAFVGVCAAAGVALLVGFVTLTLLMV